MQVFLPYPDIPRSVRTLDPDRLGNQIWREAKTLINGGWKRHPVAKMWEPYKPALAYYALEGLAELSRRPRELGRGSGKTYPHHLRFFASFLRCSEFALPHWLGDPSFHESHRSNLLRKRPDWYGRLWGGPSDIPYVYPSQGERVVCKVIRTADLRGSLGDYLSYGDMADGIVHDSIDGPTEKRTEELLEELTCKPLAQGKELVKRRIR